MKIKPLIKNNSLQINIKRMINQLKNKNNNCK